MEWLLQITKYFDALELVATHVREYLATIRSAVMAGDSARVQADSLALREELDKLRMLRDQRTELLEAAGHPPTHRLLQILKQSRSAESLKLVQRGQQLEQLLRSNQQQAQALLVTEYFLIQAAADVLSLLTTGALSYVTPGEPDHGTSGRVLDRAA